jgi:HSP20 family protein
LGEHWWRRRKRKHPWFSDFSEESDQLEKMMDEMSSQNFRSSEKRKPQEPSIFGFSVTLGPDSNPRFRKFGNPQPSYYGSEVPEEREPLVDVIEEDREVVIVAELLGVKKEDVQIHATQCNVTILVDTIEHKYYKEVALPVWIDPESIVATYKNGVLQIRLKKLVDTQLFTK